MPLFLRNFGNADVERLGEFDSMLWSLVIVGVRIGFAHDHSIVIVGVDASSAKEADADEVQKGSLHVDGDFKLSSIGLCIDSCRNAGSNLFRAGGSICCQSTAKRDRCVESGCCFGICIDEFKTSAFARRIINHKDLARAKSAAIQSNLNDIFRCAHLKNARIDRGHRHSQAIGNAWLGLRRQAFLEVWGLS